MSDVVILTGAAGFIGSHLAASLLAREYRVIGIDNFDAFYPRELKQDNLARLNSPNFELVEADICDAFAMEEVFERVRPNALVHIAALAGVRPSLENPIRYTGVNVGGLVTLLEGARKVDCRRIVFASSSSVYGDNAKVPFAETDPVDDPISPYAKTKRTGEVICSAYSELNDMTIAALRFFTVYGPSQRPDLAIGKFMRMIARDETVPMFGDGSTSRDYTYIDDIIEGVLAAYDRVAQGPREKFRIYNLGSCHPISLGEMIEAIGRVVGKTPRIQQHPMQPGDVRRTHADLTRSEAELGYAPQTPFVEGLSRQWKWLQARLD